MQNCRPAGVQVTMALRLVVPEESTISVQASLEYTPNDPFAVHIIFRTGLSDTGDDVSWAFSRELLTEGLYRQAGLGDVKIWPWADGRAIGIALSSPDGYALFEVPREPVEEFLARTYAIVPSGEELDRLDMDQALTTLLRTPNSGNKS